MFLGDMTVVTGHKENGEPILESCDNKVMVSRKTILMLGEMICGESPDVRFEYFLLNDEEEIVGINISEMASKEDLTKYLGIQLTE